MIRRTRQRDAIHEVLQTEQRPLTAQEIYDLASSRAERLGLRTVYRIIREMVEEGRLVSLDYPGQPPRYEPASEMGDHAHFICRTCNRVLDLPVSVPDVEVDAPPGFSVTGQEVIFFGTCPDCQGAKASG